MRSRPPLLRRGHLPRNGPLPGCARSARCQFRGPLWHAAAQPRSPGAPHPRPPSPRGARAPTWRGRHGLQAGVGTAVVAAAPVPRALGVGLAARRLAGAGGQRARRRRAAVGAGLPGARRLLGLRGERASAAGTGDTGPPAGGERAPVCPAPLQVQTCTLGSACARLDTWARSFLRVSLTIPVFARSLGVSRSQRRWIKPHHLEKNHTQDAERKEKQASSKENTQCDSIYTLSSNTGKGDVWCEKSAEWSPGGWGPGAAPRVSGGRLGSAS